MPTYYYFKMVERACQKAIDKKALKERKGNDKL